MIPSNRFDLALFNVRATGVDGGYPDPTSHFLSRVTVCWLQNLMSIKSHTNFGRHPSAAATNSATLLNSTELSYWRSWHDDSLSPSPRKLLPVFGTSLPGGNWLGKARPGDWVQLLGTRLVVNCMIESTYHSTKSRGLNPRPRPQLGGSV